MAFDPSRVASFHSSLSLYSLPSESEPHAVRTNSTTRRKGSGGYEGPNSELVKSSLAVDRFYVGADQFN